MTEGAEAFEGTTPLSLALRSNAADCGVPFNGGYHARSPLTGDTTTRTRLSILFLRSSATRFSGSDLYSASL